MALCRLAMDPTTWKCHQVAIHNQLVYDACAAYCTDLTGARSGPWLAGGQRGSRAVGELTLMVMSQTP